MSWDPHFYDMRRMRDEYNSLCMIKNKRLGRRVTVALGYNPGKNRRELLALFSKSSEELLSESSSQRSPSPTPEGGDILLIDYLNSRRRKEFQGTFILDLRGNAIEKQFRRRINDEDLDILFEYLQKRPKISGLHLAYNNLTNYGFTKLSNYLADQSTIYYVNVMNNEITSLDQKMLAEDFSKWKVQCLNLRGNKIGQKGGEILAHLLTLNSTIRHLGLGETEQTVNSIIAILDSLIKYGGNNTLTKLDLTRTLTRTESSELCRHIAIVLEVNRSLVELVLCKNNITDLDLERLLEGFRYGSVLLRLILSCNQISSHGAELLSKILPITQIKVLALASNRIGDAGAKALGRTFFYNKLQFLDVSMNQIEDFGMTHLLLAICRPVDGLLISGNKLTDHTAKVIHAQITNLSLHPKSLDIRLWFDDQGNVHIARRNLWTYSEWYYYVHEWKDEDKINHCCCPIRGGLLFQLKSDE